MPSMSPRSAASTKRRTSSRSRAELGSGARSRAPAGRRVSSVARARCSAALTEASPFEHVRHLGAMKAEDVAQHESGALAWREMLKRRDEREPDSLAQLVARLRRGVRCRRRRRAGRRDRARARSGRRGGSARAAHPSAAPPAGVVGGRAACSGSGSSRCGTARRATMPAPRSARVRARRRAGSPGAGLRRPARSRRFGSSGARPRAGRGRSARGTRPRPQPGHE